jgi:hypothetical protein
MFSWFTEHRRRRLLDEPFPEPWLDYLRRDMPHYEFLSPDEQQLLRDYVQIFVAEKNWEFLGGLKESDEIRVAIAGQACLLLLGLEDNHNFYKNVESVLVYPTGYKARASRPSAAASTAASFRSGRVTDWARRGGRGRSCCPGRTRFKVDATHSTGATSCSMSSRTNWTCWAGARRRRAAPARRSGTVRRMARSDVGRVRPVGRSARAWPRHAVR